MRLLPFSRSELREVLALMGAAAGIEAGRVDLHLFNDADMARLNWSALGLPGPTNILSFPEGAPLSFGGGEVEPAFGSTDGSSGVFTGEQSESTQFNESVEPEDPVGHFLGTLVLAPETLHRECLLYGQEPEEHTLRLLAHGLAHLLGHDHGPRMDAVCRQMEAAATF